MIEEITSFEFHSTIDKHCCNVVGNVAGHCTYNFLGKRYTGFTMGEGICVKHEAEDEIMLGRIYMHTFSIQEMRDHILLHQREEKLRCLR
jgi:hypothetical protein